MTLTEATKILKGVDGRDYGFLKDWGISTIREAIRTTRNRKSTKEENERATQIEWVISRKY